jgi:hypothetical protein
VKTSQLFFNLYTALVDGVTVVDGVIVGVCVGDAVILGVIVFVGVYVCVCVGVGDGQVCVAKLFNLFTPELGFV